MLKKDFAKWLLGVCFGVLAIVAFLNFNVEGTNSSFKNEKNIKNYNHEDGDFYSNIVLKKQNPGVIEKKIGINKVPTVGTYSNETLEHPIVKIMPAEDFYKFAEQVKKENKINVIHPQEVKVIKLEDAATHMKKSNFKKLKGFVFKSISFDEFLVNFKTEDEVVRFIKRYLGNDKVDFKVITKNKEKILLGEYLNGIPVYGASVDVLLDKGVTDLIWLKVYLPSSNDDLETWRHTSAEAWKAVMQEMGAISKLIKKKDYQAKGFIIETGTKELSKIFVFKYFIGGKLITKIVYDDSLMIIDGEGFLEPFELNPSLHSPA